MKSIKNILITSLLTIGAFSAVTFTSCSKSDSTCPVGYEGTDCKTLSSAKFIGTWNVTEPSCGGNYTNIVNQGTTATTIIFSNLGNFSTPAQVIASADQKTLLISNFTDATGRKFSGSGTYSGTGYSVTYTVTYTDNTTETCTATFSK